jgi:uncharacterized membrane protein YoaK (UPF0700 family)
MLQIEQKDLYKKRYALLWSLLSLKAGMINAAGFLILGSFVSHVTGFGTQIGVAIGHDRYILTADILLIPISFILGSFYVGYKLDKNYSEKIIPDYHQVQILITLVLGLICLLFYSNFFSIKNQSLFESRTLVLITLLCFACGLKNGLTTWITHGKIRTTHMTGISTDIGLHLHKMFRSKSISTKFPESKRVNIVRIMTLISFFIGSFISALLVPTIGYKVFYICFFLSVIFSLIAYFHRRYLIQNLNFGFDKEDALENVN